MYTFYGLTQGTNDLKSAVIFSNSFLQLSTKLTMLNIAGVKKIFLMIVYLGEFLNLLIFISVHLTCTIHHLRNPPLLYFSTKVFPRGLRRNRLLLPFWLDSCGYPSNMLYPASHWFLTARSHRWFQLNSTKTPIIIQMDRSCTRSHMPNLRW